MTVTAEQAKAMLDAESETTRIINEAYERGLVVELDIEARHHANSVQQLAATVVELWERLAIVEAERDAAVVLVERQRHIAHAVGYMELQAERDKLARWKAEAMTVLAGWNQVWEDAGRPGALGESTSAATAKHIERLQAAIDKVLALHRKTTEEMLDSKCANEVCEHEDECPSILVDVCGCCAAIAQQVSDEYWPAAMDEITWPCPTYVALTQGGEGS